jgi:DNA polymerase-4
MNNVATKDTLRTEVDRSILHVDMDAFFVSVELLQRPDLVGKPVVVGGTGGRGVVAAASYEARRFGVFSAMPSSRAQRLCPNAIFLPANHALYSEVSEQLRGILLSYTPLVEQISVDEAFLDVTGAVRLFGTAQDIAWAIRTKVQEELRLSCSIGIASNKFIAKLASEHAKPVAKPGGVEPGHQVFEVLPGHERAFLQPLPVQELWGVGPATLTKLQRLGISTIADLGELGEGALVSALGEASGRHLFALAHAIDDRPVVPDRDMKSIGQEETFAHDLHSFEELRPELVRMAVAVARRVRAAGLAAVTVSLKIKFSSFQTITKSVTPRVPLTTSQAIVAALEPLLREIDPGQGVRLLGVSAQRLGHESGEVGLFDAEPTTGTDAISVEAQWSQANDALDAIAQRYGKSAIRPASSLGRKPVGETPYGPNAEPGAADSGPGAGSS